MFLNIWKVDINVIREGYFINKIIWSTWLVHVFDYTLSVVNMSIEYIVWEMEF